MITAFVLITAVVAIFLSGACAHLAAEDGLEAYWMVSLVLLVFGAFGIYALIVGK